jgi:Protein of unknown function (DUF3037)
MRDLRQCEYFLVRYNPDRVRGECVNIGVVLREASGEDRGAGETQVRFTRDWRRVRCLDPDADISTLELIEADIRRMLETREAGSKPFLDGMLDSWSNHLEVSIVKSCLAENLAAKMDSLMEMLVDRRKREAASRKSGRQVIYDQMRTQFEHAGVWQMMRKRIPVEEYTGRADNLRIDCGYGNGRARMFHAIALDDLDTAKVLAFTAAKLAVGVKRREDLDLDLTAVVEPLRRKGADGDFELNQEQLSIYEAGKSTMEESGIQVITTSLLPQIAEAARMHLRV